MLGGPLLSLPIPQHLAQELKGLIWNSVWQAANSARAKREVDAKKLQVLQDNVRKDGVRSNSHLEAVVSHGVCCRESVRRLQNLAWAAGEEAAEAVQAIGLAEPAPPDLAEDLWDLLLKGIQAAAAAVVGSWKRHYAHLTWAMRQLTAESAPAERLPEAEVKQYWAEGVLGPLDGLDPDELRQCQEGLARFLKVCQEQFRSENQKILNNHAVLPWLYELACHERIVQAVASVLKTEDVLLYSSHLFLREPGMSQRQHTGGGWHKDEVFYPSLSPAADVVTVCVALSPCSRNHGCIAYRTGSGDDEFHCELRPGEFSVHSASVMHCGGTNRTRQRRDLVSLRYVPSWVCDKPAKDAGHRDLAVLVCGCDKEQLWRHLPRPLAEWHPQSSGLLDELMQWRFSSLAGPEMAKQSGGLGNVGARALGGARIAVHTGFGEPEVFVDVAVTCQRFLALTEEEDSDPVTVRVPLGATVAVLRRALAPGLPQGARVMSESLADLSDWEPVPERVMLSAFAGRRWPQNFFMAFSPGLVRAALAMTKAYFQRPENQAKLRQLELEAGGDADRYNILLCRVLEQEAWPPIFKHFGVSEYKSAVSLMNRASFCSSAGLGMYMFMLENSLLMRNAVEVQKALALASFECGREELPLPQIPKCYSPDVNLSGHWDSKFGDAEVTWVLCHLPGSLELFGKVGEWGHLSEGRASGSVVSCRLWGGTCRGEVESFTRIRLVFASDSFACEVELVRAVGS